MYRRWVNGAGSEPGQDWVKDQQMPGWLRFTRAIPRVFFIDKVIGHGTVGMITHAGLNIFNPPAWRTYWPAFFQQYKLLGWHDQGAYHERMMQDLVRDPNYIPARRAGLANDPQRYFDDYQNNALLESMGKIGLTGNRGSTRSRYSARPGSISCGISCPESTNPAYAKMLADSVNHSTGVVGMRFREWSNWTFFAPKLEGSRWAWMVGDPLKASKTFIDWRNSSPEARAFAMSQLREKAIVSGTSFTLLAMNQGLLSATGSDQKINFTNPRKGDFLSFKVAGHNFGVVGPMLGMVRLFANLVHASTGTRGQVESLSTRSAQFGEGGASYLRGKLSPFAGFGMDVLSQSDFQGRPLPFSNDKTPAYLRRQGVGPYGYGEYASIQFTPIPVSEAIREVWHDQGMSDNQINVYLKALATGVVMGSTGARLSIDTQSQSQQTSAPQPYRKYPSR